MITRKYSNIPGRNPRDYPLRIHPDPNERSPGKGIAKRSSVAAILICTFLFPLPSSLGTVLDSRQVRPSGSEVAPEKPAGENFRLQVTQGSIPRITLSADRVKAVEVAAQLAVKTGIQVRLGPAMQKGRITAKISDQPLEPALRMLAPRALVDYETGGDASPRPLAIYLLAPSDPEPAWNAILRSKSDAMLLEGNTEDSAQTSVDRRSDEPLQVQIHGNLVTIRAQKQFLAAIMVAISTALGIPADIDFESAEILDISLTDTPLEEAISRLSPRARLCVRSDVHRSRRIPLLLRVVPAMTRQPHTG